MEPSAEERLDPTRCPLCGRPNRCANEIERASGLKQPPCWCTQVAFDAGLLEGLPPAARIKACLCRDCATARQAPAPVSSPPR